MLLNNQRAFKDRCRSDFALKMAVTNPIGRCRSDHTAVPAISYMDGA